MLYEYSPWQSRELQKQKKPTTTGQERTDLTTWTTVVSQTILSVTKTSPRTESINKQMQNSCAGRWQVTQSIT